MVFDKKTDREFFELRGAVEEVIERATHYRHRVKQKIKTSIVERYLRFDRAENIIYDRTFDWGNTWFPEATGIQFKYDNLNRLYYSCEFRSTDLKIIHRNYYSYKGSSIISKGFDGNNKQQSFIVTDINYSNSTEIQERYNEKEVVETRYLQYNSSGVLVEEKRYSATSALLYYFSKKENDNETIAITDDKISGEYLKFIHRDFLQNGIKIQSGVLQKNNIPNYYTWEKTLNEKSEVVLDKFTFPDGVTKIQTYKILYDNHDNWIRKEEYSEDGLLNKVIIRNIKYFPDEKL